MAIPVKIVAIMSDGKKAWVTIPTGASPSEVAAAVTEYLATHPVTGGNSGILDCGNFNTSSGEIFKIDLGGF